MKNTLDRDAGVLREELYSKLRSAIEELDSRYKDPILMLIKGIPYKEVVEYYSERGINVNTIKSRIHWGQEKLRRLLSEYYSL